MSGAAISFGGASPTHAASATAPMTNFDATALNLTPVLSLPVRASHSSEGESGASTRGPAFLFPSNLLGNFSACVFDWSLLPTRPRHAGLEVLAREGGTHAADAVS